MSNDAEAVIGIDLGGTNTEVGLVDREGKIIAKKNIATQNYDLFSGWVEAVAKVIRELGKAQPIKAIGIGAPNGNYFHGTIERAPNLPWLGVLPLADMLSERLKLPAVLTNDANAAAIGEMYFGKARGLRNFMVVTIGTGLGSGIVVNGELLYGHTGFAGEMGHTTLRPGGRQCTCGRVGCLEAYVSARGLIANAAELMATQEWDSPFKTEADLSPPVKICEAAKQGDALSIEAFRVTGEYLGEHIADVAAILSPEAVFLFGGLTKAGKFILEPTRAALQKYLLNVLEESIRVEISALRETNAGIVGASALAWNEFKS